MWDLKDSCPNPPLTDAMIEQAERELGVQLPEPYLEALRIKNGGSTVGSMVKLLEQDIPKHLEPYVSHGFVSLGGINGIGASYSSVLETAYMVAEWELPNGLVLLDGDGHSWIAFDYRESMIDPPVVFVDSDSGDTLLVANNFADLFGSLVPEEDLFDEDGNFIG